MMYNIFMTPCCDYCNTHPEDAFSKTYHETQYGFPLKDDNLLLERLILEIDQAGLSWITILQKASLEGRISTPLRNVHCIGEVFLSSGSQ